VPLFPVRPLIAGLLCSIGSWLGTGLAGKAWAATWTTTSNSEYQQLAGEQSPTVSEKAGSSRSVQSAVPIPASAGPTGTSSASPAQSTPPAEIPKNPEPQLPATPSSLGPPAIVIPRLSRAPSVLDFLTMRPEGDVARQMTKVSGFVQRDPHDGTPVSQRTEAYLGYDEKNLYVVFVCFDQAGKVRAHEARREDVQDDDNVEIMLDTFHDRRRAYAFQINPLGVQWDAIWTEAPHEEVSGNFDTSFDTLWYSQGKVTPEGYVAWMAIPFKSLRFPPTSEQSWGIILYRGIIRENENAFWPEISQRFEGRLGQAATMTGLEGISPGRNVQLIPYGLLNSFRDLDTRDPNDPHFENRAIGGTFGLDSKIVFNDSLVLDLTANPDFSQVESDEPQVTVNQRFAVYFPEKRPFFIENADYFRTPINLFFTRQIANPSYGVRLTGKAGPYSIGVLTADDRAPGLTVAPSSALAGSRQYFTVARISRDIFKQSSIGAIYTDEQYPAAGGFNRIGGLDSRIKFASNWTATLQSVASSTQIPGGVYQAGPASFADTTYSGVHTSYEGTYKDISRGFTSLPGFVNRVDIRDFGNTFDYRFRPVSGPLVAWGPSMHTDWVWAHDGTRLDLLTDPSLGFRFKGQTFLTLYPYTDFHEQLRPVDFAALSANRDYHEHDSSVIWSTSYLKWLVLQGFYFWGNGINFVAPFTQTAAPCPGSPHVLSTFCPPFLARSDSANLTVSLRPVSALRIDNTYLFSRLRDKDSSAAIFNNHIIRTKWNWQFNRELSVRMILQYTATLASSAFTSLPTTKQLNGDFLITYLIHPGTAIYVGYNSDFQNLDPALLPSPSGGLQRSRDRLINDGRLFFVKVSYLFRF
jgi:hypothetical protein